MDLLDLAYALVGVGAPLAGLLPRLLADRPMSMPIIFLGLGMAVFALVGDLPDPDPIEHPEVAERLTGIGVTVALMGAGLELDRRLGWRSWSSTWRLLAVAMPLTIAATARLGWWWIGLARPRRCCSAPRSPPPTRSSPRTSRSASPGARRTARPRCASR